MSPSGSADQKVGIFFWGFGPFCRGGSYSSTDSQNYPASGFYRHLQTRPRRRRPATTRTKSIEAGFRTEDYCTERGRAQKD